MTQIIHAFILGVVQGVAEWLPISSSGHLIVLQHLFGLEGGVAFDVFLHLSSLIVMITFFRRDIGRLLAALYRALRYRGPALRTDDFRLAVSVAAATVVTAVIGLLLKRQEAVLDNLFVAGAGFAGTALLLWLSRRAATGVLTLPKALLVGFVQGLALLPGLSRSGSTIATAKLAGVKNEEAFRFSFLLAIPSIAGAVAVKARDIGGIDPGVLAVGFLVSLVISFFFLGLLRRVVLRNALHYFGYYCLAASVFTLVLAFLGK